MVSGPTTSPHSSRFRVLVLGSFALERDGVQIDTSRWQRRIEVLFKLLAIAPNRQRLRDELVDLLWPETPPERGLGNLRMLVHRLRLAMGEGPAPVLSDHGWIALNPAYNWELDLERFEALAAEADGDITALERAAALYRGEPLIEDRYEDWAMPIRERAQRTWRDICLRLGNHYRSHGSYDDAARWFERVLTDDPVDEEALRGLLVVHAGAGRPGEAMRRFRHFERQLADELGVPPAAETVNLVEGIKAQLEKPAASLRSPAESPLPTGQFLGAVPENALAGREEELERILFSVEAVEGGAGRVVLLAGEAGSGKTRLAQEVMMRLRERGFMVVAGCCYQRHRSIPYYPFLDALALAYAAAPVSVRLQARQRWPQLEWLLPEQVAAGAEDTSEDLDEQVLLFRAAAGFLTALAEERPLALLLDDLHWADDGSLDLLHHLARQTRGHRVLVLATYRDADISRDHPLNVLVRELAREGLLERIPVRRLGPEGTSAIVTGIMGRGAAPAEFSEFVHRRTKGNPFFIHKMVTALGGRYRLVREIGAGGMGRVFEAVDCTSGRRLAAKIMFARTEADPKAILRFQQEGAVLAALDHPNIVKVHEILIEEHASFIVMELLEGQSLGAIIHSEQNDGQPEQRSLRRIKGMVQQVASALGAAHERSVIHRDVKPDNIMVDERDHVTVTDFGIARLLRPKADLTTLTSTGMTMGTPLYMAPEQLEGKSVDARADIYSLGAVMYELTTGRPPFVGDDPLTVAFKHVNEPPLPPRLLNPTLPEDWEAVILRALAKDQASRFQTAVAMERAVAALDTEATAAALSTDAHRDWPSAAAAGAMGKQEKTSSAVASRAVDVRQPITGPRSGRISRRGALSGMAAVLAAVAVAFLLLTHTLFPTAMETSEGTGPGQFHGPTGISVDRQENVYVVDQGNNRIQELSPDGRPLAQWGTQGKGSVQFDSPSDLAIGPDGSIYVSDIGNKRIPKLQGGQQVDEYACDCGGLAIDNQATLYATNYANGQIEKFSRNGDALPPLRISGVQVGSYSFPAGIAVDTRGIIYIADRENNRILEVSPAGKPVGQLGTFGRKPGQFDKPTDIALDARGNIYVADANNDRIQKLSPSGSPLAVWGRGGTGLGQFTRPVSIAVDAAGNIYVADHFNNRVQKFSPSGRPLWATQGQTPLRG